MSLKKNREVLESISRETYVRLTQEAIVSAMLKQEVAGQRVFYRYLNERKYDITPESMDKHLSDGIVGNAIIECKLNGQEGGGPKKAYEELYETIPNRLKSKGERLPFFRIYVELETCLVEVYDCHCHLRETFDWHKDYANFRKYFDNNEETFEYDLLDEGVDLVEVIQNIYKVFPVKAKIDAYNKLKAGIVGWFKPFDFNKVDINRLILNNDRMNEKYVQKNEGAFFTPHQYVRISTEYVLNAIERAKREGYDDYVIVDRCAGVGNLESQFSEEVYSHLILGTINEAEALTANIRFNGLATVKVVDALEQEGMAYYQQAIADYKQKANSKKLAVIFLENPPYAQLNSNKAGGVNHGGSQSSKRSKTWTHQQMTKGGQDLDEQFVFSAFKYFGLYAYVHYGPVKIWKSQHLVDKEVIECYLCNRKHFNATEAAIALIHWTQNDAVNESLAFDSDHGDKFVVKKVHKTISDLYIDEGKKDGVCVVEARNFSFASPRLTGSLNDGDSYGKKWVSERNLLKVLPLFCAARDEVAEKGGIGSDLKDYRVIDTLYKSSDKGTAYQEDADFLQSCLLWALCTHHNHCQPNSKIWAWGQKTLSADMKATSIWTLYTELTKETGLNGLFNIESYSKSGHGKLWREHFLFPKVTAIKKLLQEHYSIAIRPRLLKYELLK